jgi:hypothetical protein
MPEPGNIPSPYFTLGDTRDGPSAMRARRTILQPVENGSRAEGLLRKVGIGLLASVVIGPAELKRSR